MTSNHWQARTSESPKTTDFLLATIETNRYKRIKLNSFKLKKKKSVAARYWNLISKRLKPIKLTTTLSQYWGWVVQKKRKGGGGAGSETFTFLLLRKRRRNRNLTGRFLSKGQILLLSDVYTTAWRWSCAAVHDGGVGGCTFTVSGA